MGVQTPLLATSLAKSHHNLWMFNKSWLTVFQIPKLRPELKSELLTSRLAPMTLFGTAIWFLVLIFTEQKLSKEAEQTQINSEWVREEVLSEFKQILDAEMCLNT